MELHQKTFTLPSGYSCTIREQNGADDDIISNVNDAATLKNLSKFIAAIVVDYDGAGKITWEKAHNLPSLDRYCILVQSRIFSLGQYLELSHQWPDLEKPTEYVQDLKEVVFDYGAEPTAEYIASKPDAIPYYPQGKKTTDIGFTTRSGKKLTFDLLTGASDSFLISLPLEKQTKNALLLAHNLKLEVEGKYERVQAFDLFSPRDMAEIRANISSIDPIYQGLITLNHPSTGETTKVSLMAQPNFFYLGEEA